MNQSPTPFTQSPQGTPFQGFSDDSHDSNEFSDEEFGGSSKYDQDLDDDEEISEEEEDFTFQIPANTKEIDPKEQRLQVERLKERNEKLQGENKKHQYQNFSPESDRASVYFKKISRLSRPKMNVKNICYIAEINLLLVLLLDGGTLNIYCMANFKLIAVKSFKTSVTAISYSSHLKKVIIGGNQGLIQILNPLTFQVENEFSDRKLSSYYIHTIEYVPTHNIILAATNSTVYIRDTNLNLLQEFSPLKNCHWELCSSEIFAISENRLLISCHFQKRKILILINLKTNTLKTFPQVYIPDVSCLEMTENDDLKVFTSLVGSSEANLWSNANQFSYPLAQMTFCYKTEELVISKRTASLHSFTMFQRIVNSRFFFAKRKIGSSKKSKEVLLAINKDKIEIVKVLSKSWNDMGKCFMMMKDRFSVVEMNDLNRISVFGMKWKREENEKNGIYK